MRFRGDKQLDNEIVCKTLNATSPPFPPLSSLVAPVHHAAACRSSRRSDLAARVGETLRPQNCADSESSASTVVGIDTTATGTTREAPRSPGGIVRELGPGLIIAGSVVGSGELIATTIAGAEAGFYLLWLIIGGCVIKVFAQLEIGKHTVVNGRTSLDSLARLPGWKPAGLHWIAWAALLMFLTGIGQMGGVLGGVGQAFSAANPLRAGDQTLVWSAGIAVLTAAVLFLGRYALIERVSLVLVGGFTLVSLVNLVLLQGHPRWAVRTEDLVQGLSFGLPPVVEGLHPVATALAAFGIIGMAAGELVFYPYWCLEKGYARHVGPDDGSQAWTERARGWIRVMRWDAWGSLVVYTISTVAFYLLGAAVLGRSGLVPQGGDLVLTLSSMYEPVFGSWARELFLLGAVAVLYSTFFVNHASSALVWTDAVRLLRPARLAETGRHRMRRLFSVVLPLLSFVMLVAYPNPRVLVLLAGMTQTLMLPLIGLAVLWFRFGGSNRLPRSKAGDVFLVLSVLALGLAGGWLLLTLLVPNLRLLG